MLITEFKHWFEGWLSVIDKYPTEEEIQILKNKIDSVERKTKSLLQKIKDKIVGSDNENCEYKSAEIQRSPGVIVYDASKGVPLNINPNVADQGNIPNSASSPQSLTTTSIPYWNTANIPEYTSAPSKPNEAK